MRIVTSLANSGAGSLRDAIDNAQSGEDVEIRVSGTVLLESRLDIYKIIRIRAVVGAFVLDAGGMTRILNFNNAAIGVEIEGVTFQNGISETTNPSSAAGSGGAARLSSGGDVTFRNCQFLNNTAQGWGGGAIRLTGASLTLENCLFDGNTCTVDTITASGGVCATGFCELLVRGCTFRNNIGINGSAIHAGSSAIEVYDSLFENEDTRPGLPYTSTGAQPRGYGVIYTDGIYSYSSKTSGGREGIIDNCTFRNCQTIGKGTVFAFGYINAGDSFTIKDCLFEGNTVTEDSEGQAQGGLRINRMPATVSRCRFKNNSTTHQGGGLAIFGNTTDTAARVTVKNCIFDGNTAADGGQLFTKSPVTIWGCTFVEPASQNNQVVFVDPFIDNLSEVADCIFLNSIADLHDSSIASCIEWPTQYITSGGTLADPLLVADYFPSENSPVIGAGTTPLNEDFFKLSRSSSSADIGAIEYAPEFWLVDGIAVAEALDLGAFQTGQTLSVPVSVFNNSSASRSATVSSTSLPLTETVPPHSFSSVLWLPLNTDRIGAQTENLLLSIGTSSRPLTLEYNVTAVIEASVEFESQLDLVEIDRGEERSFPLTLKNSSNIDVTLTGVTINSFSATPELPIIIGAGQSSFLYLEADTSTPQAIVEVLTLSFASGKSKNIELRLEVLDVVTVPDPGAGKAVILGQSKTRRLPFRLEILDAPSQILVASPGAVTLKAPSSLQIGAKIVEVKEDLTFPTLTGTTRYLWVDELGNHGFSSAQPIVRTEPVDPFVILEQSTIPTFAGSNTQDGYTVTASSEYSSEYQAWEAYNRSNVSPGLDSWITRNGWGYGTLAIAMPEAKTFVGVKIAARNSTYYGSPDVFSVDSSEDGSTWTVLESYEVGRLFALNEIIQFDFPQTTATHFRINVSSIRRSAPLVSVGATYLSIGTIEWVEKKTYPLETTWLDLSDREFYQLEAQGWVNVPARLFLGQELDGNLITYQPRFIAEIDLAANTPKSIAHRLGTDAIVWSPPSLIQSHTSETVTVLSMVSQRVVLVGFKIF